MSYCRGGCGVCGKDVNEDHCIFTSSRHSIVARVWTPVASSVNALSRVCAFFFSYSKIIYHYRHCVAFLTTYVHCNALHSESSVCSVRSLRSVPWSHKHNGNVQPINREKKNPLLGFALSIQMDLVIRSAQSIEKNGIQQEAVGTNFLNRWSILPEFIFFFQPLSNRFLFKSLTLRALDIITNRQN